MIIELVEKIVLEIAQEYDLDPADVRHIIQRFIEKLGKLFKV